MELKDKPQVFVPELSELFVGILGGIVPQDFNAAGCWIAGLIQSAYDLKQGGFARAGRANNGDYFSLVNSQINSLKHRGLAVGFIEGSDVDDGFRIHLDPKSIF